MEVYTLKLAKVYFNDDLCKKYWNVLLNVMHLSFKGVSAINHILPYEYTNTLKKLEVSDGVWVAFFNQFINKS